MNYQLNKYIDTDPSKMKICSKMIAGVLIFFIKNLTVLRFSKQTELQN